MTQTFEILNSGHCDLFVICDLRFVILKLLYRYVTNLPKL